MHTPSVVMLLLSVAIKYIMLSVVMLNVVMLNVVAPFVLLRTSKLEIIQPFPVGSFLIRLGRKTFVD